MTIRLKRVYEEPSEEDGQRILVERLWPRGLSKQAARIDLWARDVAPSTGLRRWFDHDPERWDEFRRRYTEELDRQGEALAQVEACLARGPVTFVFASREERYNNAVALKALLETRP